jgi:hypothetical protein
MRKVSGKSSINFFFLENHAVCEIIWKNIVEPGRPGMTVWPMPISHCVPTATHTHTHKLRICTTYCFSTANVVARKHPKCYFLRTLPILLYFLQICSARNGQKDHNSKIFRFCLVHKEITRPNKSISSEQCNVIHTVVNKVWLPRISSTSKSK